MKPNPFPALNHLTVPVSFIYFTSPWQQLEAGISTRMGPDLGNSQALSAHMKTCVMLKTSPILAFWWVVPGRRSQPAICGMARICLAQIGLDGRLPRSGLPVDIGLRRPVTGVRRALMGPEGSRRRRQMVAAKGVYMRHRAYGGVLLTQARVIMVRYTRCD